MNTKINYLSTYNSFLNKKYKEKTVISSAVYVKLSRCIA